MSYQLAQMNIARFLYPADDPRLEGFISQLDTINALAENSPGFVWRLKTEAGNSLDVRGFDDPSILVNMSVWTDCESLFEYTYHSEHVKVFADRAQWFEKRPGKPPLVLWWIESGTIPTVEEGRRRLDLLAEQGPSPAAFTLKKRFDPPV